MSFLASIPSPSNNVLELGPLEIHYYGIAIGIGVLVAYWATYRRYERYGGDPALVERTVLWAVGIGFLGARLAYVSTHTARFEGEWYKMFFIWEGGLALFGGLIAGAIAAWATLRRHGGSLPKFADGAAVGIPLAQAIGRIGNYFNQELFGTPSTLPWAVEIDSISRPAEYRTFETFHPTFLYEMLWNLVLTVPIVLLAERSGKVRQGGLIFVYAMVYGTGRFLMELLRTDTTFRFLGISRNGWVSVAAVIGGALALRWWNRRGERETAGPEGPAVDDEIAAEGSAG